MVGSNRPLSINFNEDYLICKLQLGAIWLVDSIPQIAMLIT